MILLLQFTQSILSGPVFEQTGNLNYKFLKYLLYVYNPIFPSLLPQNSEKNRITFMSLCDFYINLNSYCVYLSKQDKMILSKIAFNKRKAKSPTFFCKALLSYLSKH